MAVQVGDHAEGVGQVDAVLEDAAALVVDEDEGEFVRPVHRGEGGHERLEQFGLAGAGGTGDESVRPVLHQVEGDRAFQYNHAQGGRDAGGDRYNVTATSTGSTTEFKKGGF